MKHSLLPLLLAATAAAQSTWIPQFPTPRPAARNTPAMSYDATTQSVLVYGGGVLSTAWVVGDMWRWNGTAWTQVPIQASPQALAGRDGCGFCRDVAGDHLLFSGYRPWVGSNPPVVYDETWRVQANGTCTLVPPAVRPSPRRGMGMVRTNQGVVMFGGRTFTLTGPGAYLGDTWRWDGLAWSQLSTASAPSPRAWHAMTFDSNRNVVVLFGGDDAALFDAGDTWEFDGTAWQQRFPAHSPPARFLAGVAFAPPSGQTVVFGGFSTAAAGDLADTWVWDGTDWHSLPTAAAPPARSGTAMTYDAARQQVFLFGGRSGTTDRDDCWYLDLQYTQATYTAFGNGCAGPNAQIPSLAALPGEVPALGTTSHLRVTNLPPTLTLPLFVLGLSNTVNAAPSYPLPFDLGPLGWPGCNQLVSFDAGSLQFTLTGQADLPFTVPMNLTLIGMSFHAQAFVLYQPTGAAVSNGITGLVGT